ncbi:S-adenosyl-L-methionine-dependent methyltransferases superfamily protein [Hibiscus syriacus]|uniref:S-adenosyl-L-methionine-dependent methyltransferases superfamily protein n=1 Tax=Hibiscus syriacus TaxID=106335 RepID=A0A6A2XPH7_HIBSY|nr:S-adenosyl-L-methionine-dependent methyltransferases superfamily protein [Hibiscus syriacus]
MSLPSNLNPDEASPPWLNKGDNSWQLTVSTLVGLQSVPGYRMAFGDKFIHFLGVPNVSLDANYLIQKVFLGYLPNSTLIYFQFVFAAITLILVAGALLGRINFLAWMLFVPLWLTFSYTITAYSIWCPQGWLSKKGIIDYSGGYVIHLSSGVAGTLQLIGTTKDKESFPPNNILLMLAGAGLLWMGWTGFNGGDTYTVTTDGSLAILNTHVCTATSLLPWLMLDIIFFGKPSAIGATQGMITGLVCIISAAGVVQGFLKQVDDTMAVFHTYAVAGSLGGILTGVFAVPKLNRLFYMVPEWQHYIGLFYGFHTGRTTAGFTQLVPLRLAEDEPQTGDDAIHGEEAYALWGDGEKYESKLNSVYEEFPPPTKGGEVQMVRSYGFDTQSSA